MKRILLAILLALLLTGCAGQSDAPPSPTAPEPTAVSGNASGRVEISLDYNHRGGIASNQFAVWIENGEGLYVRTLYATRFTAEGGWKSRPDALALWVERSGLSEKDAEVVDAFSGATPKSGRQTYVSDCTDEDGKAVPAGEYYFYVEGTIFWKDAVVYKGVINIGGEEASAQAEAEYSTDAAKSGDMISGVEAAYIP